MPKLTIEGEGIETRSVDVEDGKRLIVALKEAGVDQLHLCGGKAKCTTCKVEFTSGEPSKITAAEKALLEKADLQGVRLSCQLTCDADMSVKIISRLEGSGRPGCGTEPDEQITPAPEWLEV